MTTTHAALLEASRKALDALEQLQGGCTDSDDGTVEAITVWCPEIVEELRAALAQAEAAQPVASDCAGCGGAGTVLASTSHLGPDDYDYDGECEACQGTGSGDIRDAIAALPYSLHRVRPGVEVISRAAVLKIVEARSRLYAAPQPAEAAQPVVGWRLVPVEPTDEMVDATHHGQPVDDIYRDMLAAAPRPLEAAPTGPLDDFGRPIVYDTEAVDNVTHALTGDEGEDDSVTVLERFASYVQNVWPGKPALQVLIEYEEKLIAEAAPKQEAVAWDWLRGVMDGIPTREERIGGQRQQYVAKEAVMGWIEEGQSRAKRASAQPQQPALGRCALQGKYGDVLGPFVALMETELHANARKGDRPGWLSMPPSTALLEIYWHTAKLSAAVKNNDAALIREHSADVANMAMMLLDVCGGLDVQPQQPAPEPVAWLCELAQEDGSTRTQIVTENPDGLRWNDAGEPSPFRVTPLYAAPQPPEAR